MRKQKTILLGICILLMTILIPFNKTKAVEEIERTELDFPIAGEEFDEFQEPMVAPMPDINPFEAIPDTDDVTTEEIDMKANIDAGVIGIENAEQINPEEEAELEKISEEEIESDENITAEDLEINDPTVLPDRKILYPLKNIWRSILMATTFDPVKKANLRLRFASEKLIEAKKIADKTDDSEIIEKAIDIYKDEVNKISEGIEKIKEKAEDNDNVDALVERITDSQLKHVILIDKMEKKLSQDTIEKIHTKLETAREQILGKLSQSTLEIADAKKIRKKFEKAIEKQGESDFRHLRHIEVLRKVEENAPEEAKEAIQKVIEKTQERFEEKMQNLGDENKKVFQYYIKNMSGNEVRHLEVINDLESKEISDEVRNMMEKAKEEAIKRIEIRIEKPRYKGEKKKILEHLKKGTMENIRIIKELEGNLPPETVEKIIDIKSAAMENFKEKIENINFEEQEKMMEKIEKFHDVKQFEMFKEMEEIIPENKKEFWKEMEGKAKKEIKKDIENAKNAVQKTMILKKLAGDVPENIDILGEYMPDEALVQEIMQEQIRKIERKTVTIQSAERLQIMKEKIQDNEQIRNVIEKQSPNIINQLRNREEKIINDTDNDEAAKIREQEIIRQRKRKEIKEQEQNINASMANPAAIYCEKNGGKLIPTQTAAGVDAICVLPDGTQCGQWDFFRGECGREVNEDPVTLDDRIPLTDRKQPHTLR